MLFRNRNHLIVRSTLVLALLCGMLASVPVQAASLRTTEKAESFATIQQDSRDSMVAKSRFAATQPDVIFPTVVSSIPQHGDVLTSGTTSLTIQFSADMLADGTAFAVNRTSNYFLVEDGADGKFQTSSCTSNRGGDDTAISISTASYNPATYSALLSINGGALLSAGSYQLLICGSTPIHDASGKKLNGGTDSVIRFLVVIIEQDGFDPMTTYYDSGYLGYAAGVGDLNDDGLDDVAMTTQNQVVLFLQNHSGGLNAPVAYPAGLGSQAIVVGDLNKDGKDDLVTGDVYAKTISVFLQEANGRLAERIVYPTVKPPYSMAIGDVNSDGLTDIVVVPSVGVFTQNADGSFAPMVDYLSPEAGQDDVAIGDVNNDGRNDVVKMNGIGLNPDLSVYLQSPDGTLATAVSYSLGCFCIGHGIEIGDVTGDGLSDVVVSYGGNRPHSKVAVLVQDHDGLLRAPVPYDVHDIPTPLELGDVNLDGALDVLTLNAGWSSISVLIQQNGTFLPYQEYGIFTSSHPHPQSMAVGDFNEDGAMDVAFADYENGLTALYHHVLPMPQVIQGGNSFPLDDMELADGISQIAVQFNRQMRNDGELAAANHPSNYLLVEAGEDGGFQTSTCVAGRSGDDVLVAIDGIEYNASKQFVTLSVNGGAPLMLGKYQLVVCHTIEAQDFGGIQLNKGLSDSTVDFSVWPAPFTISGNAGLAGVTLSYLDGNSKTAITDGSGDYSFRVSEHWSGTVTPTRVGYVFSPANRVYTDVLSNQADDNYIAEPATYTISGNVGLSDVSLEYTSHNGPPSSVVSDSNGDYSITVSFGWSGHIRPIKKDYTFSPGGRDYQHVVSNISGENYLLVANPYSISGNVGLADVAVQYTLDPGLSESVMSNENGEYSFTVPENWTGDVMPYKQGYRFTPVSRSLSNVNAHQFDQDFTPQKLYTISGNTSASWVMLSYTDEGPETVYSNSLGDYSLQVPEGWSGTVTPYRAGFTFSPTSLTYTELAEDQSNQDYAANPILATISGNTGIPEVTLRYVDGVQKTILSDSNGDYSFTVPFFWSGSLTPSKTGYRFTPASRNFAAVRSDQTNQNFSAELIYIISGNAGIPGVSLRYMDGTLKSVISDSSGNYSFSVAPGWSGDVTPSKSGYIFTPASISYANLSSDQPNQDYAATAIFTISGNAGTIGAALSYVEDGTRRSVTSDNNGNYSITVKIGWSGVITPSKAGVTFIPLNIVYSNVHANQPESNFLATITVTNILDSGEGSLRQAVNDAVSGAVIQFNPSLAGETITLASTININKNVILDGSGLEPRVSISGNNAVRIFKLGSNVITLRSLILKNGKSTGGSSVAYYGGAIYTTNSYQPVSYLTVHKVDFLNNVAYQGGAIYGTGKVSVTESKFIGNSSQVDGGAIYVDRGDLILKDSLLQDNAGSSGGGGAIYLTNTLTTSIESITFQGNSALYGGAIFYDHTTGRDLTIRNSLFLRNRALSEYRGGGAIDIYSRGGRQGVLENNSFYENQSALLGGAIQLSGNWILRNNTFSNNQADSGGNLNISGGLIAQTVLYNNIFANNTGGMDCVGPSDMITGSHNLVEDGAGSCAALLHTIVADPMLGPLTDNGGSTQTMALLSGSPAIDSGDDLTCVSIDQRGMTRPQGSHCDIGAYEYSGSESAVDVNIGAAEVGSYVLAPQESRRQSYPNLNNGPVRLNNTYSADILAAERVIYRVNGTNTSFSEMMGLPASQVDTTYWLPWYNNVDLDTQLRIANVSGSQATVTVTIGGVAKPSFNLAAGASTRLSYPGVNGGPVKIVSTRDIVAAERLIYKVNNVATSFHEMLALPQKQLDTTYWLPWYNNADLETQLRIANVSGSSATVTVTIGGVAKPSFNLVAGASTRVSYPGVNDGPVKIVSTQNIVAAARVIYKANGVNTSFTEMMAQPANQVSQTYRLPWYNNVDLDTQLRIGNVGGASATVTVTIGGVPQPSLNLAAGESTRISFPSVNNGPVEIVSTQDIVVAERVIYKINGTPTSFTEMMGLPDDLLDTTFWFPWYNNIDLDTQLRFGVP